METDEYGYGYGVEKKLAPAFDKVGLSAFIRAVRARFDAATADDPERSRPRWAAVLRCLFNHCADVEAYIALAEETGTTPTDCLTVAKMVLARGNPAGALGWAERGLGIGAGVKGGSAAEFDLGKLRRELLVALGRTTEARDEAWNDFQASPGTYRYAELMKHVPEAERDVWHRKAIEVAERVQFQSKLELLAETGELDRLSAAVRRSSDDELARVGHHVGEAAAGKLEAAHPDAAARLWASQGLRILRAKKSRYYDAALADFERARRCFGAAGLDAEWQRVVALVRAEHRRKLGFMGEFEQVVAGGGPTQRPSFLEAAKTRWRAPPRG